MRMGGDEYQQTPQPVSLSDIVLNALGDLAKSQGVSMKEIVKFLTTKYDMTPGRVNRQVGSALRKALRYGLLEKKRNMYHVQNFVEGDSRGRSCCNVRRNKRKQRKCSRGRKRGRN